MSLFTLFKLSSFLFTPRTVLHEIMVEKDFCHSCLTAVRVLRVSLVDELEGHIDSLIEVLVRREVFTRDDREEVLCQPGPRARGRKVLDILECKGEEAARIFLAVKSHHLCSKEVNTDPPQSKGMQVQPQRLGSR